MSYNLWCKDHLDENAEHRKDCELCDPKGNVVSDCKKLVCPMTEKVLKLMGENMSGGPLKIGSMSLEQKSNMMKKRSKKHYKKEIEERHRDMTKQMQKGLTGKS